MDSSEAALSSPLPATGESQAKTKAENQKQL